MADSREEQIVEILRELRADCPGVQAAVLISSDAMPLASDMAEAVDEEVISATASALISASERVARELARGEVEQLFLRGGSGDLVLARVNENASLACVVNHQAKMGMTLLEVNRCARKLSVVI
ncbi:MAG: roadblock/LC7 domain-containing protein [Actinobacteria bacterium]|nr:roadblock/LC7 domain-containing protein [Actinomycetota bacterium]